MRRNKRNIAKNIRRTDRRIRANVGFAIIDPRASSAAFGLEDTAELNSLRGLKTRMKNIKTVYESRLFKYERSNK